MNEEVNSIVKILENKLYLLNPSLAITPTRKGHPVIACGTGPEQSPVRDIQILSNNYKFTGPPVEQIINDTYAKATNLS